MQHAEKNNGDNNIDNKTLMRSNCSCYAKLTASEK